MIDVTKKKWLVTTTVAFFTGALVMAPFSSFADTVYKRLSFQQAAKLMVEHDVQTQITLEDDELQNWRLAFTPRDGYTPPGSDRHSSWTAAYRTNVEPLRREAEKKQQDYQILAGKLQREAMYYALVFNYWLMKEQHDVSRANLDLAKKEYERAKARYDVGLLSQTDLYQVETSLNNAQISYDEAQKNLKQLQYQINQKLGYPISQAIDIYATNFSYVSDTELNVQALIQQLFQSHPSLDYVKKELEAYQKGYDVVTRDDFIPPNQTLPVYLEREIAYWQLRLDQQKEQLELIAHSLVDELIQLRKAIELHEKNLEQGNKVYEAAVTRYEEGFATYIDVEQARLNVYNTRLQLTAAKKDYMEKKENLRLFKEGHIPAN